LDQPAPAYEGDEPYVFVSYSHQDEALVSREIRWLQEQGVNVWYDTQIQAGSEWSDALANAISRCSRFLYFITPNSVATENCRRELNHAVEEGRSVLAVHLEETDVPGGIRLNLNNRQAIFKYRLKLEEYRSTLLGALSDARSNSAGTRPSTSGRDDSNPRRSRILWLTGTAVALMIGFGIRAWITSRPTDQIPAFDRSVTVLQFSVIGGGAETTGYADALTEELRTDVAGYQELRSVAAEDASNVRQVNDASYVVAGNVQRLRDSVRVGASMSRTDDHQTVWAKTFERAADGDLVEMASTLGRFVRQNLVQDQQCESVKRSSRSEQAAAAYCAALAERARFGQTGNLEDALELRNARRAIALDPNIADAYRIAAYNYTEQGATGLMDWHAAARDAHAALDQGLALAPDDPKLLTAQGQLQSYLELDGPSAAASFRASLASDPLQPYAYQNYQELALVASTRGDLSDAADNYRRSLRLYDGDAAVYLGYASVLWYSGQMREAIHAADAGLRLVESPGWTRAYLLHVKANAYYALGQKTEANKAIDDGLSSAGPTYRPLFAGLLAKVGRRDEAKQILATLERLEHPPIDAMVSAYAALGDDRMFDWIHTAIDHRTITVVSVLRADPRFSEARRDPRWAEVMKHLESEEAKGRIQNQSSN
jgi:TolB-like protein/tetratricopeptide (TPR) repeat protein